MKRRIGRPIDTKPLRYWCICAERRAFVTANSVANKDDGLRSWRQYSGMHLEKGKIPGRDYIPAHDAFIQISWDQLDEYT